jgi:hypothetical protein
MANEITLIASLQAAKGPIAEVLARSGVKADMAGTKFLRKIQTIPTTAGGTALDLTGVATVGWAILINTDATNYVDLMTAVSGTAFARLLKGEFALIRICPTLTAPAMLAHTASVDVEMLLLEI